MHRAAALVGCADQLITFFPLSTSQAVIVPSIAAPNSRLPSGVKTRDAAMADGSRNVCRGFPVVASQTYTASRLPMLTNRLSGLNVTFCLGFAWPGSECTA